MVITPYAQSLTHILERKTDKYITRNANMQVFYAKPASRSCKNQR